jgi:hypothetical protein
MVPVAALAAMAAVGNLTFVLNRLPDIHWSSLAAGIFGGVVAVVLCLVLGTEYRASRH